MSETVLLLFLLNAEGHWILLCICTCMYTFTPVASKMHVYKVNEMVGVHVQVHSIYLNPLRGPKGIGVLRLCNARNSASRRVLGVAATELTFLIGFTAKIKFTSLRRHPPSLLCVYTMHMHRLQYPFLLRTYGMRFSPIASSCTYTFAFAPPVHVHRVCALHVRCTERVAACFLLRTTSKQ